MIYSHLHVKEMVFQLFSQESQIFLYIVTLIKKKGMNCVLNDFYSSVFK